jgi:general secretion pathway protein K
MTILKQFLFPSPKRASILIISLWVFAVLSILSVALAGFVFQQIKFANFFMRSNLSLPLANAACFRVFEERKEDVTAAYDSFLELSAENTYEFCSGAKYKYYFMDKKDAGGIQLAIDESALVNINFTSDQVLSRLPGLDEDLAKKILGSGRRPFKFKEELLLIEGIDKERFNNFKDFITVYGQGKVNVNTAPQEVLLALGLDEELVRKIIRYRKEYIGIDGQAKTEDDGAFTNAADIISELENFISLSTRQQQDLISLANALSVKSDYLRLNIIPQLGNKQGMHYSIVICPETGKIISWSER